MFDLGLWSIAEGLYVVQILVLQLARFLLQSPPEGVDLCLHWQQTAPNPARSVMEATVGNL